MMYITQVHSLNFGGATAWLPTEPPPNKMTFIFIQRAAYEQG